VEVDADGVKKKRRRRRRAHEAPSGRLWRIFVCASRGRR
jgi:hypothetical protein